MSPFDLYLRATAFVALLALNGCGSISASTGNVTVVIAPSVTAGASAGGSGTPGGALAGFTSAATLTPTPKQGLEIITTTGTTPGIEVVPALTLEKTTTGFNLTTGGEVARFDTRPGSSHILATNDFAACVVCTGGQATTYRVTFNDAAASTLSYAAYGIWMKTESVAVRSKYGALATGVPSTSAQIPSTGTATFTGRAVGIFDVIATTDDATFSGAVSFNASFANRSISGTVTDITTKGINTSTTGTMGNLTFGSGVISGAFFSGSAGSIGGSGTVDVTGASGQFGGGFYGPTATEVAGSFALTSPTARIVGSFGAKR